MHVDADHPCDGALTDVELGVAEQAGEQGQRLRPAALAQLPQGLPPNLCRRTGDVLCDLR